MVKEDKNFPNGHTTTIYTIWKKKLPLSFLLHRKKGLPDDNNIIASTLAVG